MVSDIQFYHLLSTPLEVALPKLVATAYERGMRVCIVAEKAYQSILDDALWTFQKGGFLPHGREDEEHAAEQPVLIAGSPTRVNDANLLILTDGSAWRKESDNDYERVFDIFNGNDTGAVEKARSRWKTYAEANIALTYIKQRDNGGWDKVKESGADA